MTALRVLLRADVAAQMRSYRSLLLGLALPFLVLLTTGVGKRTDALGGPAFRVGLALTVGLVSICTIGYSTAVARDRDRGVFQRLRVTPAPASAIMGSRWIIQVAFVLVMSIAVLIVTASVQHVTLSAGGFVLTVVVALVGSAVFLSIGQAIAGLIPSADTLNAAGRLIYVPLIGLSLFGNSTALGTGVEMVSRWSPGGCLETLLAAAMGASDWNGEAAAAVVASAAYAVVFAGIGVRYFRWTGS